MPPSVDVASFHSQGYVVVPGLLPREEVQALSRRVESLLQRGHSEHVPATQLQTQYDRSGRAAIIKINQLTETDPAFRALSHRPELVDGVEALLGPGAKVFRDVLIARPALSNGKLSYHQDSAYWDVEPRALVSAWIALTDVSVEAACLRVIPGSHDRDRRHGLFVRGRRVPAAVVTGLRKVVSYAGTGDNPGTAGGSLALWKLKRLVLARATRYLPALGDLQDYRAVPEELDTSREVALSARAGDVIFFHSLLLHTAGPNTSDVPRYTPIISYMSAQSTFTGKGTPRFRSARGAAA